MLQRETFSGGRLGCPCRVSTFDVTYARIGRARSADVGHKCGQTWSSLGRFGKHVKMLRACLAPSSRVDVDQLGPTLTAPGQAMAELGPNLAQLRPTFTDIGHVRANSGRQLPHVLPQPICF